MMERAQRLYDCITDIGDAYLQEAEQFQPEKEKILTIHWKRWSTTAAALVLAVGLGCLAINSLPKMESSSTSPSAAPPSSTTATEAPAAAESSGGLNESAPWGDAAAGGQETASYAGYIYKDYSELAQDADVIVEGTAITVTPGGMVEEDESYTVVELEVTDVLKGDVEPGDVIQAALLEHVEGRPVTVQEGDRSFYFLAGPFDGRTFKTKSLCQGIVPVDGDTVLADGSMLDQGEGTVSMDKDAFRALIRQAAEP